jgi:hypothetical protein
MIRAEPSKREAKTSKRTAMFVASVDIDYDGSSLDAQPFCTEFHPRIHCSPLASITFATTCPSIDNNRSMQSKHTFGPLNAPDNPREEEQLESRAEL